MWWSLASAERQLLTWPGGSMRRAFDPDGAHPSRREFGPLTALDELRLAPGTTTLEREVADHETVLFVRRGAVEVHERGRPPCHAGAGSFIALTGGAGAPFWLVAEGFDDACLVRLDFTCATAPRRGLRPFVPRGDWPVLVGASQHGADGGVPLESDARVRWVRLRAASEVHVRVAAGRRAWVQLLAGEAAVAGASLVAGDGAAFEAEPTLLVAARSDVELLVIDVEDTGDQWLWNGD